MERVTLTSFESVVAHGTLQQNWLVLHDGSWISARDVPGAESQMLDPRPGVIWEAELTLRLPRGTWLERVRRQPRLVRHRDPFSYLEKESRGAAHRITRQLYQVGASGSLLARERT